MKDPNITLKWLIVGAYTEVLLLSLHEAMIHVVAPCCKKKGKMKSSYTESNHRPRHYE